MSDEKLYPLSTARTAALEVVEILRPACHRIEIAGSVRRAKPQVHDIDLVLWPVYEKACMDLLGFEYSYFATALEGVLNGSLDYHHRVKSEAKIVRLDYQCIPVELYLADPGGENFDALLQMRTGSAQFNIRLAQRAVSLGLSYHAGYGIFDPWGKRKDDGTERGIFEVLKLEWAEPKDRV